MLATTAEHHRTNPHPPPPVPQRHGESPRPRRCPTRSPSVEVLTPLSMPPSGHQRTAGEHTTTQPTSTVTLLGGRRTGRSKQPRPLPARGRAAPVGRCGLVAWLAQQAVRPRGPWPRAGFGSATGNLLFQFHFLLNIPKN
jgi:hypothetical protein